MLRRLWLWHYACFEDRCGPLAHHACCPPRIAVMRLMYNVHSEARPRTGPKRHSWGNICQRILSNVCCFRFSLGLGLGLGLGSITNFAVLAVISVLDS